jgi:hypothetical protein
MEKLFRITVGEEIAMKLEPQANLKGENTTLELKTSIRKWGEKMISLKSQRTMTRQTKERKYSWMRVKEKKGLAVIKVAVQVVLMS